jgi:hypothetical protein
MTSRFNEADAGCWRLRLVRMLEGLKGEWLRRCRWYCGPRRRNCNVKIGKAGTVSGSPAALMKEARIWGRASVRSSWRCEHIRRTALNRRCSDGGAGQDDHGLRSKSPMLATRDAMPQLALSAARGPSQAEQAGFG